MLGRWWALVILIPLSVTAVGADVLRARSDRFSDLIQQLFGRMMRSSERAPAGGVVLNGATWVLVAATLLTLFFPVKLAAPVFASFLVADAAAAVVGLRFGRRRWSGTHRTVEGSLAFAVAAFICLLPFSHILVIPAAAAALAGACAEAPEWPVNDNVRVPPIMAGVLFVFGL